MIRDHNSKQLEMDYVQCFVYLADVVTFIHLFFVFYIQTLKVR